MSKNTIINLFIVLVCVLLALLEIFGKELKCSSIAGKQGYDAVYDYVDDICYIVKDGKLVDYNKFIEQR